jgi:hypothetical protein
MNFSDYLKKATDPSSYKIGIAKFASISSKVMKEPISAHTILKDEFFEEMRIKAILEVKEEHKEIWEKMSYEQKENLVEAREDKLWDSVKTKGLLAFTLIFGINL